MAKIYNSITELIGNTPIIKLNNIVPEDAADVYVKIESFNPGSSVKDRIALRMIEDAEKAGTIKPGDTIVEPTSGNTGIGLAWVGAAKGYKIIIVMPETMSLERRKIIQAYGAELVLTPGSEGMKGAIAKAKEVAAEKNGWVPLQFANPSNPAVHEATTGAEIIEAFGPKGLDAFVAGVGTGGTVSGVSHALKKANSDIKVYAVEADESAVLSGEKPGPHKIQGISSQTLSILNLMTPSFASHQTMLLSQAVILVEKKDSLQVSLLVQPFLQLLKKPKNLVKVKKS